jgi:phosphoribosylamine--glycine ligase
MKGFQLQRKVEGVEIAVCGFFDGERFIDRVNFNFEHKMWDLSFICSQKTRTERQTVAA